MKAKFSALIAICLAAPLLTLAQDSSITKTTVEVTESETWYASPWVWIIGAAVFILLLVALLGRGGSSRSTTTDRDRVTVTKTVERDSDVG